MGTLGKDLEYVMQAVTGGMQAKYSDWVPFTVTTIVTELPYFIPVKVH